MAVLHTRFGAMWEAMPRTKRRNNNVSKQAEAEIISGHEVSEEDALRARFYAFLAHLLMVPPSAESLDSVRALEGDETVLGRALGALSAVAAKTSPEAARDEYNALFIGVSQGELTPYASYYLTGFLQEKPLANLRGDMIRLSIECSDDLKDPEDHIAVLCEMMHGLIAGAFGAPTDLATQKEFFDTHIRTWAPRFFEDLERAKSAVLYMPVGTIGRAFMEIEAEAFEMTD